MEQPRKDYEKNWFPYYIVRFKRAFLVIDPPVSDEFPYYIVRFKPCERIENYGNLEVSILHSTI